MHGRKYPFMSLVKDINEYDHDKPIKPYHEKRSFDETIKLFDIIAYIKAVDWEYVQDRLRRNKSTASTKITKYCPKLCVNDLFDKSADKSSDIYLASVTWYKRHNRSFGRKFTEMSEDKKIEILESSSNSLYTRAPVSITALPDIAELININAAVIRDDLDDLDRLSKELFVQLLMRKKVIPLYYNLRYFDIPDVLNEDEDEKVSLLPLLLAQNLYGTSIKTDDNQLNPDLLEKYKMLMNAFDKDTEGKKEYIVILYALEKTPYLAEAIYQSWELGSRKNVRIIVLTSNQKGVLDVNCSKFFSIEDESKKCILDQFFILKRIKTRLQLGNSLVPSLESR